MASEHVPRLTMMRLLVGEAGDERAAIDRHLAECAACARTLEDLRGVKERGARQAPPPPFPWRPAPVAWGGVALVAATLLAVSLARLPWQHEIRAKGPSLIEFACKDGPRVWACRSGERVRGGTAVGVGVVLPEARWSMILGRDRTGVWRVYFPAGGDEGVRLEPGRTDPLGSSLVLDAGDGEERFTVVLGPRPFARRELGGEGADAPLRVPDDFQTAELVLQK